ncbi:MAG: hypothetical protein M0P58_01270 [Bacteroidales bacterium]|nr:hypothetical protein [Bacteroidales bacterium]
MKKCTILLLCITLLASVACRKKNPDPPAPVRWASFTLNGVSKNYTQASKFSKDLCSSSTYCCRFTTDINNEVAEQLKIGIPGDPIVGHIYQTGEYRFSCFYVDKSGTRYDLATAPFRVIFSLWEGQGGWAKGTFSGWMISTMGDSIHFDNGFFQNEIWTLVP